MSDSPPKESATDTPNEVKNTTSPQTPQISTTPTTNSLSSELPDVQGLQLKEILEHTNTAVDNMNSSSNSHLESCIGEDQLAKADDLPKMLTKFTVFPQLSPELRIKIWKIVSVPRLVSPFSKDSKSPPAILQVNQESRHEALKEYSAIQWKAGHRNRQIFINYETDLICISYFMVAASQMNPVRKALMSFELALLDTFPNPMQGAWRRIRISCPNLSELVLISYQEQRPTRLEDLVVVADSSTDITPTTMDRIRAWDVKEKAAGRNQNMEITFMEDKGTDSWRSLTWSQSMEISE